MRDRACDHPMHGAGPAATKTQPPFESQAQRGDDAPVIPTPWTGQRVEHGSVTAVARIDAIEDESVQVDGGTHVVPGPSHRAHRGAGMGPGQRGWSRGPA